MIECAANPVVYGGIKSADGAAVLYFALMWCLLLLDVLLDHRKWGAAAAPGKI